jgi:molybdopterin-guanine dinucleotide biosynthesis protein A
LEQKIVHISGVLLAGGKSRRMGEDKRTIMLSGKSLFHHALHVLESVFSEIIIVVDKLSSVVDGIKHRVVTDLIPEKGSIGGLYTGLTFSSNSQVFAVACDMPFLNPAVIRRVCELSDSTDVTMVQLSNGLHPMHSVYSKRCLLVLRRMIDADQLRIQNLLFQKDLNTKILGMETVEQIDPQCKSFLNLNTPADVELAERLMRQ